MYKSGAMQNAVPSKAARPTITEHEILRLSEGDRAAFFEAMVHPAEPSERLARAFAEHGRRAPAWAASATRDLAIVATGRSPAARPPTLATGNAAVKSAENVAPVPLFWLVRSDARAVSAT